MTDMKLWVIGKNSLVVLTIFTIALYVLSFCFNWSNGDLLRFRQVFDEDLRYANKTKKILFWTKMFSDETFYMGTGYIARDCPVKNCYATNNRNVVNLTDFDAVLFHGNDLNLEDLPKNRSPRQWYVFVNLESPANRPMTSYFYEDFFNITMTYRLDSDIVWTYAVVKDVRTNVNVAPSRNVNWSAFYAGSGNRTIDDDVEASLSKTIRGKTKPIVWFVSNCITKSGREEYVNELSKHIPVDVYGKCGNMFCPRNEDCFARVAEPGYFFYLSFENSLCDDYVTEKLYNSLRYNVVPIVYGGANYSRYAPPRSYIDVFDFDTPKSLAEYLKKLMKNPRKYSEYFAWKTYYKIEDGVQQDSTDDVLLDVNKTNNEKNARSSGRSTMLNCLDGGSCVNKLERLEPVNTRANGFFTDETSRNLAKYIRKCSVQSKKHVDTSHEDEAVTIILCLVFVTACG